MKVRKDGRGVARVSATTAAIVNNPNMDLSTWDDEELMRGRRRDKGGAFRGHPVVSMVPVACLQELNRRRFARAADLLAGSLEAGAIALRSIIEDEDVDPAVRLKGIELLYDRVIGRPRQSVELHSSGSAPDYRTLAAVAIVPDLADAIRLMEAEDANIIDAEVVEAEG